jgi:hypothetical protein
MSLFELPYVCSLRALATWIGSTLAATALFWFCFATCVVGCVDTPLSDPEPQARVVAAWDPLVCGDPHRVVIELEDGDGSKLARSVPCGAGGITIDIPRWGVYRGRIYAWAFGPEIRSVMAVHLDVDAPVIYWTVETPR